MGLKAKEMCEIYLCCFLTSWKKG